MPHVDELMGDARAVVLEGDCREILPTITGQVDHVVTDPPYEAEAHTQQRRIKRPGLQPSGGADSRIALAEPLGFGSIDPETRAEVGAQIARLAKRWALVFCQVEAVPLWRDSLEAGGHGYRRACVWIKPDGMPMLTGDRPGMGYESFVSSHGPGRSVWNGGGRVGVFVHNKYDSSAHGENGRNVHPTTKPLSLMLELVELFTSPEDLILDPFGGSGTTAIAALRLGRRCLLIERDPKYAQLCRDRVAAELNESTLQASRAGQLPLLPKT